MRPVCVVCLGSHSARMVAAIATGLDLWSPWRSCAFLDERSARLLPAEIHGVGVTALATRHPSSAVSIAYLAAEAALIAAAAEQR